MANVKEWSNNPMVITYGKGVMDKVVVDTAIKDADVQCFHFGKNIKTGKLVFCSNVGFGYIPSERGDSGWGNDPGLSIKPTFCSSNHAKLYKKNGVR